MINPNEILAARPLADEDALVEAIARALCKAEGTSQCASICLSRFASDNREGRCPDAVRVHGRSARAALDAIRPTLAALQARAEAVEAEEVRIDALRLKAFSSGSKEDRQRYFEAASKWFEDRHYRRMGARAALGDVP